jgi:hypothetical protein
MVNHNDLIIPTPFEVERAIKPDFPDIRDFRG